MRTARVAGSNTGNHIISVTPAGSIVKTISCRILCVGVALVSSALPMRVDAQKPDTTRASIVSALTDLRAAVARKDWPVMSQVLPAGSVWQKQIEQLVRNQSEAFSFWTAGSQLPLDSLHVHIANPDTAEVEGPLYIGRTRGYWTAKLKRVNGRWMLGETREEWGQ